MSLHIRRKAAFALPLLLLGVQPALAIPFSGMFTQDDDYQFFTFTIASPAVVTLQTSSYAAGGFVPYLHVWDSTGLDLGGAEPTNNDASYAVDLSAPGTAGTYYVGLTVANNKATGDFPGGSSTPTPAVFDHDGLGNFTGDFANGYGCGPGPFWTSSCDQRLGNWALEIIEADSASLWPADLPNPAPEPATLALGLAGAAAFAPHIRRRRPSASA